MYAANYINPPITSREYLSNGNEYVPTVTIVPRVIFME